MPRLIEPGNQGVIDLARRRWTMTASATAGVGVVSTAIPFVASMAARGR